MRLSHATIAIPETELLLAIWYPDGAGAQGLEGSGVDTPSDEWKIRRLERRGGQLIIDLERKD